MIGAHWRRDWARSGNSAAAAGPRRSVWGAKLGKGMRLRLRLGAPPPPRGAGALVGAARGRVAH